MSSPTTSSSSIDRRSQRLARRESGTAEDGETKPIVTLGVLADIQYAPIDDGHSYSGTPRYYRHALEAARHAAQHFQDDAVDLVVNLGDIVDGKCERNLQAVDDVLEALGVYTKGPVLHAYGNHCLYNMDRATMQQKLGIPFVKEPCGDLVGNYSHVIPNTKLRLIVLDSYDVAIMQRCSQTSRKHQEAVRLLQRHNSANYEEGNENSPEGLVGVQKRYVAFNGAIGEIQLTWLRHELEAARQNRERVLVLSHQPILPLSTNPVCLMWNYKEVLAVLRDFSDVVMASLSGHAHKGGYDRDPHSRIHFRVLEAVLENNDPHKTYAMVDIYDDRLHVRGFGNCQSAIYYFDHQPIPETSLAATTAMTVSNGGTELPRGRGKENRGVRW